MPRTLIDESNGIRTYRVTDAKGNVVGLDAEPIAAPEPDRLDKLLAVLVGKETDPAERAKLEALSARAVAVVELPVDDGKLGFFARLLGKEPDYSHLPPPPDEAP